MTNAHLQRRLAAVVAADVVGYSRLMGIDEVGTLAALKAHRREVVDPAIAEHGGRIVKTTGDGILVEFASAVAAVTCAISVQSKMAKRNQGTAVKINFRIGINVGDIIIANQHEQAIAETRMAVELNPSNVVAWLALGNRVDIIGQHEEGIALLEKSLRLNAHDPHNHMYYTQLGRAYINARKYEIALRYLRESIRLKPDYANTYHVLAICLGHLGRADEGRAAAQRCEQLRPGLMRRRANWNIYLDPESNNSLTEGLRKAGLVE